MKKIWLIVPLIMVFFLGALELEQGIEPLREADGTLLDGNSVGQNDTLWSGTYGLDETSLAGFFAISYDLDSLNGDVTGKIIIQESNIRDNWNRTTVLITWATQTFDANALDTTLVLPLIGTGYMRIGFANTSATATDSFTMDDVFIYSAGQ